VEMHKFVLMNSQEMGITIIFNVQNLKLGVSKDNKLDLVSFSVSDESQLHRSAETLIESNFLSPEKGGDGDVWNMFAGCILLTNKELDPAIFNALNRSPFVVDHTIVVDDGFKTKADAVFAGGSAAAISRCVGNKVRHEALALYDQNHVATHIAKRILSWVKNNEWEPPVFTEPNLQWGFILMDMVYAQMINPHEPVFRELRSSPDNPNGLSYVSLDKHGYICGIQFCLYEIVLDGTSPHAISSLVGLHSAFIVDLIEADKNGSLVNPIEYLVQPKVRPMYLKEFKDFTRSLAEKIDVKTLAAAMASLKGNPIHPKIPLQLTMSDAMNAKDMFETFQKSLNIIYQK